MMPCTRFLFMIISLVYSSEACEKVPKLAVDLVLKWTSQQEHHCMAVIVMEAGGHGKFVVTVLKLN